MKWVLVLSLSFGAATLAASPASERAKMLEASRHFDQGMAYYRQARYEEAIQEFSAADQLHPSGVIHYNLAQAHERLGQIQEALQDYAEYLKRMPQASDRDAVQRMMENLQHRMAEREGELRVDSAPEGASLTIDDAAHGSTPQVARLPPGAHRVAAALEGYTSDAKLVQLEPGASLAVHFQLERLVAPAPLSLSGSAPPSPSFFQRNAWSIACVSLALAAAAGGVAMGVAARQQALALTSVQQPSQSVADAHYQAATRDALVANVLYGVAGAAGAAGVTVFFVQGRF
jgi:tetratricopeptide (TPR) repeat protein